MHGGKLLQFLMSNVNRCGARCIISIVYLHMHSLEGIDDIQPPWINPRLNQKPVGGICEKQAGIDCIFHVCTV